MNIVVCCKAVPGLVTDLKIGADGKAIQYQGQLLAINECDEYALEEALALKRSHGGQITAISMGNIKALDILHYALAKGAACSGPGGRRRGRLGFRRSRTP